MDSPATQRCATDDSSAVTVVTHAGGASEEGCGLTAWCGVLPSRYHAECARLEVAPHPAVVAALRGALFTLPPDAASDPNPTPSSSGKGSERRPSNGAASIVATTASRSTSPAASTNAVGAEGERRVLCVAVANVTLGPRGAAALSRCLRGAPLTILSLSECFLEDDGLAAVCSAVSTDDVLCRSLLEVDLRGNAVRDASPVATLLVACGRLQSLRLAWNRMGLMPPAAAAVLAAARTHRTLQTLDLSNNGLDHSTLLAVRELVAAAPPTLTHLNLSWNYLGAGAGGATIHEALVRNNALLVLSLDGNGLARQELQNIEHRLQANGRAHWDATLAREQQTFAAGRIGTLEATVAEAQRQRKADRTALEAAEANVAALKEQLATERAAWARREEEHRAAADTAAARAAETAERHRLAQADADLRVAEARRHGDASDVAARDIRLELEAKSRTFFIEAEAAKGRELAQQREIASLKEQCAQQQSASTQANGECETLTKNLGEARVELVRLRAEVATASEITSRRGVEMNTRLGEIKALEGQVQEAARTVAELRGQVSALEEAASKQRMAEAEIAARHEAALARVRDELEGRLRRQQDEHSHSIRQRDTTYDALRQELSRAQSDASAERDRLAAQVQLLTAAEAEREKALVDASVAAQDKRRAESNERVAVERYKAAQEQLQRIHDEHSTRAEATEGRHREQLTAVEERLIRKNALVQKLEADAARLEAALQREGQQRARMKEKMEQRLMANFRAALGQSEPSSGNFELSPAPVKAKKTSPETRREHAEDQKHRKEAVLQPKPQLTTVVVPRRHSSEPVQGTSPATSPLHTPHTNTTAAAANTATTNKTPASTKTSTESAASSEASFCSDSD